MKSIVNISLLISLVGMILACSKSSYPDTELRLEPLPTIDYTDTTLRLTDVTDITLGVSVSYTSIKNDSTLAYLVKDNFDELVFNSELKHGAIVGSNGSYNYSIADAFVQLGKGMDIYGHVLAWHRHQNSSYLNKLVGNSQRMELLSDPGFENQAEVNGISWAILNSGNPKGDADILISYQANEIKSGTRALKVVNPTSYGVADWRVQVASNTFEVVPGQIYNLEYNARSLSGAGIIMFSVQAMDGSGVTHYPGGDKTIGSSWQNIKLSFTSTATRYRIVCNLGKKADTYLIDDVSVSAQQAAPDYSKIYAKLDTALGNYINTTIGRYKDNIRRWEVVNEIFTDQGEIRNYTNSPAPIENGQPEWGYFLWSEYLKRDYGYLAFKHAQQADPTAELYINDYGMEYSDRKTDSLLSYINEIRLRGAKVDGIGTQMHVDIYLSKDKIDKMFQKLSSTGLKVRISELDIRITNSQTPTTPTDQQWIKQQQQYQTVVSSYLQFVPPAQRGGIAVWGLVDMYNWQYRNGSDFPNLFSSDYQKKKAYAGFLEGLEHQ